MGELKGLGVRMNILLDAYYDNNFGDDIFVDVITGMFPNYKFYSFLEFYPSEICSRAGKIPNLYLLPECNVLLTKNMFDGYICIGGDIFPDYGNFSKRKEYVKSVEQINGFVAFLGFSLFHKYSEETISDIREMMANADIIAPRDSFSAKVLQQIMPEKEIQVMSDLAFEVIWEKHRERKRKCIGLSVRRPNYVIESDYNKYCKEMANIIEKYLCKDTEHKVKLFGLSDGSIKDIDVLDDIKNILINNNRVETFIYQGNRNDIAEQMDACDVIICTRLHAMIACICMEIPFIPVIYEVKMDHILDEIGYKGQIFRFNQTGGLLEWLNMLLFEDPAVINVLWDEQGKKEYINKGRHVIQKLNQLMKASCMYLNKGSIIVKSDFSGALCFEKEYGKSQVAMVIQKNKELDCMAGMVKQHQSMLEENHVVIVQYLKTIEELNQQRITLQNIIEDTNKRVAALESEKNHVIEELNQQRITFENIMEESNKQVAILEEDRQYIIKELDKVKILDKRKQEILNYAAVYFKGRNSKILSLLTSIMARKESESWNRMDKIMEYFNENDE